MCAPCGGSTKVSILLRLKLLDLHDSGSEVLMWYALMTTIAAAAMALGVAASFAQGAGEQPLRDCLQRAVNEPQARTAVSDCLARRFLSENVAPLSNVNFEMRKGAVLPATVTLHPCPKYVIPMLGVLRAAFRVVHFRTPVH